MAVAVASALAAISGAQVSDEAAARRALAPALSSLTDVRRVLATHRTELITQAEQDKTARLAIPSYPLPVTLTATEVQALPPDDLERVVVERSVDLVYARGASAFERSTAAEPGSGLIVSTLNQLTRSAHQRYVLAAGAMLVFSALIGILLLVGSEAHHGLLLLGLSIFLAGVLFVLGTTALGLLLNAAANSTESSLTRLFLEIDLAALSGARRNGIVAIVLGITLAVFGLFAGVVAAKPRTDLAL
jgi:hypothetical protein